ncbi:MAG: AAA family ATPase, partial [Candidatus Promineifilaceae bacterium]
MATQKQGNLNPNLATPELAGLMTAAAGRRSDFKLRLLTPQLLLRVFLATADSAAHRILRQLAQQRGFDWNDLSGRVEMMARHTPGRDANFAFTDDFGADVPLAEEMLVVLDEALSIAQAREGLKIGSGHALAAMAQPNVTTHAVLQRVGVTPVAVGALLDDAGGRDAPLIHDLIAEARQGKARPVYQREALLREAMNLLALADARHIILVGPEGAGKRTLGEGLAQLLAGRPAEEASLRSFVVMNEAALLEDPLATIRAALRRASGGVLFVPAIERFFADRLRAPFPEQVNRELHKALVGSEQVVIGTATPAAYDLLSRQRIIRERSQRLDVPAASRQETIAILGFHKQRLEQEYGLSLGAEALETAASLADQYMQSPALPASAVQLLERACALVSLVVKGHAFNLPEASADGQLNSDDVMLAASLITKIPIARLSPDEQTRYASMVEHIHERIIGQEEAVLAVSRAVKSARVGLRDPKRPIGSFLFLGPSGVGKSELAKALAEFLFGSEEAMITLDMSEYQDEASLNRLIGAPPGYVGFEGGGQLTDYVREHPYTVVLFDEVEKAHPRVLDVLLQMMEEGRLTDNQGRVASFSETVIILTSNLGAFDMLVPVIGQHERELVMAQVRRFFRPEFLNRLDEILLFNRLSRADMGDIVEIQLDRLHKLLAARKLTLDVD